MATDHYQLRVQGLHQTEYNECVMFFKGVNLTAASYMENAEDLVNSWQSNIQPAWLGLLPASYQLLRVSAKKASLGGGGEFTNMLQYGDAPGDVAGGAASQQLCPVLRLIPGMGVKTAGKIFLPCIAESQVSLNAPNATWLTNKDTFLNLSIGPFTGSSIDWSLVIYSRKNNVFSDVLSFDTSPIIGFQRRRQRAFL